MPDDGIPTTCNATRDAIELGPRGKTGVEALTTASICKKSKVGKEEDFTLSYSCGENIGYRTISYAYCPWQNIHISDHEKLLAGYACDPDYRASGSNAICAPREICEDLCTELGDLCTGIDLLPGRCYLSDSASCANP